MAIESEVQKDTILGILLIIIYVLCVIYDGNYSYDSRFFKFSQQSYFLLSLSLIGIFSINVAAAASLLATLGFFFVLNGQVEGSESFMIHIANIFVIIYLLSKFSNKPVNFTISCFFLFFLITVLSHCLYKDIFNRSLYPKFTTEDYAKLTIGGTILVGFFLVITDKDCWVKISESFLKNKKSP